MGANRAHTGADLTVVKLVGKLQEEDEDASKRVLPPVSLSDLKRD